MSTVHKPVLVVGGGIAGMTAAVEAAEVGYPVVLVESEPFLGGRVVRSNKYFPKMCPPACGFEINTRRIRNNPRITVHTLSTVEEVTGEVGAFRARIRTRPRFVTGDIPPDHEAMGGLTGDRPDDFNMGMGTTKALFYPHNAAYPALHVLDRDAATASDLALLQDSFSPGAIDLDMEEEVFTIDVGAVILATGWRGYDPANLPNLGFGRCPDVVSNLMMERLAAKDGPTRGRILRPSNGQAPANVAFVQCAGSRDENHLPYCSAVCCMASLKQARYVRESNPEAKVTIFYIDIRTLGRLESFYSELLEDENITFVKGKVAEVNEDADSHELILEVEDTIAGQRPSSRFDMVVLATGVVPNGPGFLFPQQLPTDEYGFLNGSTGIDGVFAAGCVTHPCDVSRTTKESTGAALKAIQCLRRG